MKKATFEERKAKAIEIMKRMDIYHPYIEAFEKDNTVCLIEYKRLKTTIIQVMI